MYEPYVCLICDEFLNPNQIQVLSVDLLHRKQSLLKPSSWNEVSFELTECYKFQPSSNAERRIVRKNSWLQHLLLSPRACYFEVSEQHTKPGFSVCHCCKTNLEQDCMPKYAIANNYCVGTPPQCLLELTEIELALLTPVKTYGYCFSYTGGIQKELKGSLSYYKIHLDSIAHLMTSFDVLGLHNAVVVLLYGNMTSQQKRKAREKSKI